MTLDNKVALVTGAGSGIGQAGAVNRETKNPVRIIGKGKDAGMCLSLDDQVVDKEARLRRRPGKNVPGHLQKMSFHGGRCLWRLREQNRGSLRIDNKAVPRKTACR